VLYSTLPGADVLATISENVNAVAILLVVFEVALVAAAIGIRGGTFSIHFILCPVAEILSTVRPPEQALPIKIIISEVARIERPIAPPEDATAHLLAISVLAFESSTVSPLFPAFTVHEVIFPKPD